MEFDGKEEDNLVFKIKYIIEHSSVNELYNTIYNPIFYVSIYLCEISTIFI